MMDKRREEVRALLHVAENDGASMDIRPGLLVELCKLWLAVQDAPVGDASFDWLSSTDARLEVGAEGEAAAVFYAQYEQIQGQRVRIVAIDGEVGNG